MATSQPTTSKMKGILNLSGLPALQLVKCFLCGRFLSVPPIYIYQCKSVCGRCKSMDKSEDSSWTRQFLYENVAQFMMFPCSNESYGCKALLKWGKVEEHENSCLFKKLSCPFANEEICRTEKCLWLGTGLGLNEHLKSCHGDFINNLPEINFTENQTNGIFLTEILNQLLIVVLKFDSPEKFSCIVMVNGTSTDCDAYRYQLELYDNNRENSLLFRKSCLEDAVAFEENLANFDKMLVVELPVVKSLLKNPPSITGRFSIIQKSKNEPNIGGKPEELPDDEKFLLQFKCPSCKKYMLPPIYFCSNGHSFCSWCKPCMNVCTICWYAFNEGRNYTMEKLTTYINFPCENRDAGCSVMSPIEKLHEHEKNCSLAKKLCFLICGKPVRNLLTHLEDEHHQDLITPGLSHILDLEEGKFVKFYAMCFGSDVFRLVIIYDGNIKFSLQEYGVIQSCYNYELEIIGPVKSEGKIIFIKKCSPLNVIQKTKCFYLPREVIYRFITKENSLLFRIRLNKIG